MHANRGHQTAIALRSSLVFAAMIPAAAVFAGGEMQINSQTRTILGDSNSLGPPASQQDILEKSASDLLPYDDVLHTAANTASGTALTKSFQQSTIDSCRFVATGGFSALAQNAPPNTLAYSVGSSMFHVSFTLAQPALCRMVGTLDAQEASHARAALQMGSTGLINILADGQSLDVAQQLMLPAGQYIVTFSSMGTAFENGRGEDSEVATFDMRFATCFDPADINIDESVNVADLLAVIAAWGSCTSSQTCLADINLDGSVNVADLLAVIAAWN